MAGLPVISILTATIPDFLSLPEKTVIGDIEVDTALEQEHEDQTTGTEHPVQAGAPITDHVYNEAGILTLVCGWSNSSPKADGSGFAGFFDGGSTAAATYIDGIYSKLLELRASRQAFSIVTIRRKYDNVRFVALRLRTDNETAQALMVEATFKELILVNTTSTTLPSQDNQRTPATTAETQASGTTQIQPATPAPGGSLPPTGWGPSLISR